MRAWLRPPESSAKVRERLSKRRGVFSSVGRGRNERKYSSRNMRSHLEHDAAYADADDGADREQPETDGIDLRLGHSVPFRARRRRASTNYKPVQREVQA